MDMTASRILVVDDEPFNLEILVEHLEDESFTPVCAESGEQARELLKSEADTFSTILLDWMMPGISGLELLKEIKQQPKWQHIPVIMQTAKTDKASVDAGIQAGAYYYLSKPFKKDTLISIIKAAVSDHRAMTPSVGTANDEARPQPAESNQIVIRTLNDARQCVEMICKHFPDHPGLAMGLTELLLNGIEHGNLGISYKLKGRLHEAGTWEDEINRRLQLEENRQKQVHLSIEYQTDQVLFIIQDQGPGFDWLEYMDFSSDRAFDTHGRGVAMANAMSFDSLEYQGTGNRVVATIKL